MPTLPCSAATAEILQLRQAYAETLAERTPRLVTVTGDAGVGKSRLISDFVAGVSAEAEVLHGRCLAYGDGITFWPLVEIVRNAAGILEDDSTARRDATRSRPSCPTTTPTARASSTGWSRPWASRPATSR